MATAQRGGPIAVVRHRFTADEFERMGAAGILGPDERLELIDGEIVEMSPIGPLHAAVVARIHGLLSEGVRGKHLVRSQSPIRLSDRSEPQPDVVVLRHRTD